MKNTTIKLKCGLDATTWCTSRTTTWCTSWNSQTEWIKVNIVDFYNGNLSFKIMAELFAELAEMNFDNIGLMREEGYYGSTDALYVEGSRHINTK